MAKKKTEQPKPATQKLEFSVIAGSLKGRKVVCPNLGVTRPPLTRLRRAIFDFLNPYLYQANHLDLFSGTGSYLFESVSRGAESALGIELEQKLVDAINSHAKKYEVADKLVCRCEDVLKAIPRLHSGGQKFDIITMAPPQYKGIIDQCLQLLAENPLLTENGLLLCQHDTSEKIQLPEPGFAEFQIRKYGNTTFTILTTPDQAEKTPD